MPLLSSVAHARSGAAGQAITCLNRALRSSRTDWRLAAFLEALKTTGELSGLPSPQRPLCLLAHYYRYLRIFDSARGRQALAYARQALASGDHPAEALLTMGVIYDKEGRREEALDAFLKAIELSPRSAELYRRASLVYSDRGDLLNEYRMRQAAYENAPDDPFYANAFVYFLREKWGDYHQALTVIGELLQTHPDDVETLEQAAYLFGLVGEEPKAEQYYRKALSLRPGQPSLHEGLGTLLVGVGRREEALASYRAALAVDPYYARAHLGLAQAYRRMQRYREAIDEYEQASRLETLEVGYLSDLCTLYHMVSEFDRAADCYREVLARDPRHVEALRNLPMTLRNLQLQGSKP